LSDLVIDIGFIFLYNLRDEKFLIMLPLSLLGKEMNIEVSLLGPPQIIRATKQIDIGHRKSTALLVYLIVTKQSHSRDTLAELFWPNANASAALGNLRRALYRINRVIGENVLAASRKTISINPDVDLWVDVDAFERVVRLYRGAERTGCSALRRSQCVLQRRLYGWLYPSGLPFL
jgi:two-component SAPR family response regulator